MQNNIKPQRYSTTYQLKLPLEISTIIEVSDPVYTFCEVMDHIDLRKYLVTEENKTGRKRYDSEILLKVILFAFTDNRIVRINKELTKMHQEVLENLNSTHGALLRMNRSIQAEGAYGTIKWNKAYTRARRRGLKGINFEIAVISCGFNLHKYYLKQLSRRLAA